MPDDGYLSRYLGTVRSPIAVTATATIPEHASESQVIDCRGTTIARLFTPEALDAERVTFLECTTPDGDFVPVFDRYGTELSLLVADHAARSVKVDWADIPSPQFIIVRQGEAAAPVDANAPRIVTLLLQPI